MAYFGSRSAPLGAASPELVEATFYNFKPTMIRSYVPQVWEVITPSQFCEYRRQFAADALLADHAELNEFPLSLLELLEDAVSSAEISGLALFGGNRTLVERRDGSRAERLWSVATAIREHRGDGHNALLYGAGIDGLSAHLLREQAQRLNIEMLTTVRGWEPSEIDQACEGLVHAGLLTADRELTAQGHALRQEIEVETDRCSFRTLLSSIHSSKRQEVLDALRQAAAPIPSVLHTQR
jgi:hypothetical protein